jgi:hypothetical protein
MTHVGSQRHSKKKTFTVTVIKITGVNFILCWTCVACYTLRFRPTFIEKLRLSVMIHCFQMMYTFGFVILLIIILIFVILWCIYYFYDENLLNQLNNYREIFGCGRLIHARFPKIGRAFLEVVRTTCGSEIVVYNSNKIHKSQSLFNLTTALHVSGVTITHFRSTKQL